MDIPKELLQLTKHLVTMPTVTEDVDQNAKALHWIMEYMDLPHSYMRYYKDTKHPSLVISNHPVTKHFDVILHGHIDVVPASPEEFIPQEKNGKLYGRGTCDMKGGVAVLLLVAKQLFAQKIQKDIGIFITTDEEVGGHHGTKYLLEDLNYTTNFFISAEGASSHAIITKAKGMVQLLLEAHGISAHGAKPWLGGNAIEQLFQAYQTIQKLFPPRDDPHHWYSTMNMQFIQGGEHFTRIPHTAKAELDIRLTEEWQSPEHLFQVLQKTVSQFEQVKIKKTNVFDGMLLTKETDPYVQKLAVSLKKYVTHVHPLFGHAHGTSDARFASWKGIPAVEFGPVGKNSHHHEEYVEINNLYTYYQVLFDFVGAL